jgi:hypothetical protein
MKHTVNLVRSHGLERICCSSRLKDPKAEYIGRSPFNKRDQSVHEMKLKAMVWFGWDE